MPFEIFCSKCGTKLETPPGYPKQLGFYRHTGKLKEETYLLCPNRTWKDAWRLWGLSHDKLRFVTNPREFAAPDEWVRPDWIITD